MKKQIAFIVISSLIFAGCSLPGYSQPSNTLQSPQAGQEAEVGNTITIKSFAFSPSTLTVTAGQTITVKNNDSAPHTVTSDDGKFETGQIAPGESGTFVAPTSGTYEYHCTVHPNMKATLVVN